MKSSRTNESIRHRLASRASAWLGSAAVLAAAGCTSVPPTRVSDTLPRLRDARFVLLGEVHDNAEQHRLRAELLAQLLADGRPSRVVFEQMDRGHDADIAAAARNAESVAAAGHLDRAGWRWPLHRPLLEAALASGATISGGNLGRDEARAVVRSGSDAVPAELRGLLAASDWRDADEAAVEKDIDAGHCGALPPDLLPGMALAQRARDAALAQALLRPERADERVVLIAGNGHVRRDLGVARYLIGAGVPASRIVAVGFLEGAEPGAPFDLVRITPAAERPDPCEPLRKP